MQQVLTISKGAKFIQPQLWSEPWQSPEDWLQKGGQLRCAYGDRFELINRSGEVNPEQSRRVGVAAPLVSETPSKICGPCSECNSFDTSIPKDSIWQFCLSKGKYLSPTDLEGCEDFKPFIPYQFPSLSRRTKGDGSGYIQLHYTKQKGKFYEQYYYHYEIWEGGNRLIKSSVYIPKRLLAEIEIMDSNKEPVTKILKALGKTV
jgi:hypothetical protein